MPMYMSNMAPQGPEKKSGLKNFLNKFLPKPKVSHTFTLTDPNAQPAADLAVPAMLEQPQPQPEAVNTTSEPIETIEPVKSAEPTEQISASSPFAQVQEGAVVKSEAQPIELATEEKKSQTATDEIMEMLAKTAPAQKETEAREEIHEVAFDLKSDIGWEAELEKAKSQILIMTPEQFQQTYHKDIKYAKIAARYNMVQIIEDVLKNGNRAHAFDRVVQMARNLNEGGHQDRLVVVGEFTYIVDK